MTPILIVATSCTPGVALPIIVEMSISADLNVYNIPEIC